MPDERLDEIKTKWNIPVTLPMAVPWGKDDVVWLVGENERLRAEAHTMRHRIAVLREALEDVREWAHQDDVLVFDDGDIPLADFCDRALKGEK